VNDLGIAPFPQLIRQGVQRITSHHQYGHSGIIRYREEVGNENEFHFHYRGAILVAELEICQAKK
jgi:hypothetical protein